jgi:hypothetical protein
MPLIDGKLVSPDDAMKAGRCPECGADLRVVNPIAHRRSHWQRMPNADRLGEEGLRRMAMFDEFIAANKVRTSNMPKLKVDPSSGGPAPL